MPSVNAARPWLTRNVRILNWVSFLQDTASELLYPVLPIFLTGVLAAPVAVVGLIEGAADAAAAATKILAGRAADRRRKKPFITTGYAMAAIGKLMVALATVWPVVLTARIVDRIGKGLRGAPRDALLVAGVDKRYRGAVFGLHRAADTAGAVVGPLIGLALYEAVSHQIRPLLWLAVIPAVLSVALTRAVRERQGAPAASTKGDTKGDTKGGKASAGSALASRQSRPAMRVPYRALPAPYWRVLVMLSLFALVNFPDALLLLRARSLGVSVAGIFAAYALYNASYALLAYPAGLLSDRLPRRAVYAVGLLLFAAGYLGLGLATEPWQVYLIFIGYGGFNACTDGVGKAWVSTLVPTQAQASAQGLYQGLGGVGVLIAAAWAGLSWAGTGQTPLLISGVAALVLAIAMLCVPALTGRAAIGPELTGSSRPA